MPELQGEGAEDLAVLEVLRLGNPLLREKSLPVDDPASKETRRLCRDLEDTLRHWRETTGYGRGIAAPQVGVLKRVIFLNADGRTPWPLINPEVVWRSEEEIVVWDACFCCLSIFYQVPRAWRIRVAYQDLNGNRKMVEAEGDLSELLQHEIDHLDGVLAIDRVVDIKTVCAREEYEKRYGRG
ncbi:MAG: peptide deformylase [Candidatus Bathyarchaeia archaeon]